MSVSIGCPVLGSSRWWKVRVPSRSFRWYTPEVTTEPPSTSRLPTS